MGSSHLMGKAYSHREIAARNRLLFSGPFNDRGERTVIASLFDMSEMEQVWERLKERAVAYAASETLVSANEARAVVIAICAETFRQRPAAEAIDYMAGELVRLTIEANARQASQA